MTAPGRIATGSGVSIWKPRNGGVSASRFAASAKNANTVARGAGTHWTRRSWYTQLRWRRRYAGYIPSSAALSGLSVTTAHTRGKNTASDKRDVVCGRIYSRALDRLVVSRGDGQRGV